MAGGFSFPPPPPPPPKPASGPDQGNPQYGSQQPGRGGQGRRDFESRGRGPISGRGGQNFRGRGNANMTPLSQDGNQRGGGSWRGDREAHAYSGSRFRGPMDDTQNSSGYPPGAYVNPNFIGNGKTSTNALNSQPNEIHTSWHGQGHAILATSPPSAQYNSRTAAGHKRKLDALRGPQEPREKRPAPPAAPSVPSFGALILPMSGNAPSNQPNGHQTSMTRNQNQKPTAKSIGLTPGDKVEAENFSDSAQEDNDVDEEAQCAELGTKLTFEHNGEVMSLNNEADLAVWREERRKKWPTSNRVAEKEDDRKRIGAERKRLLAAAAGIHRMPRSRKVETRQKTTTRGTDAGKKAEPETHAPALIELNGKHARCGMIEVVEASATQPKATDTTESPRTEAQPSSDATEPSLLRDQCPGEGTGKGVDSVPRLPGISMEDTDDEGDAVVGAPDQAGSLSSSSDLSSDSGSESDSEGPPEASSTKQTEPAPSHARKPVCRYFAASGSCRDGDTCRFRHELSARAPAAALHTNQQASRPAYDRFAPKLDQPSEKGRKSIHERLVEQEQLEQDRLTLKAIKALGEAGFFNATNVY